MIKDDIPHGEKTKRIKDELRKGIEFSILSYRWGVSIEYIRKLYNEMKKDGENLIDRRSKEWRGMQFIVRKKADWDRYKVM